MRKPRGDLLRTSRFRRVTGVADDISPSISRLNGITKVISNKKEIYDTYLNLALTAKEEVLMAVISDYWIVNNADFWSDIRPLATPDSPSGKDEVSSRKVATKFRLLIPIVKEKNRPFIASVLRGINWREIEANGVTFAVYDKNKALIIEYAEPPASEEVGYAVASAILISNKLTVQGLAAIFNAIWRESEHTGRVEKNRAHEVEMTRQSRLLQDIIAHDINNYNQIISLSAEILGEKLGHDAEAEELIARLQKAIRGSRDLLEKAKRLGKVLAEDDDRTLHQVNLFDSINRSLAVIEKAEAKKQIIVSFSTSSPEFSVNAASSRLSSRSVSFPQIKPQVLADELLDEVFTNLLSNSVKYTDTETVHIGIRIEEESGPSISGKEQYPEPTLLVKGVITSGTLHSPYWKISITDNGRGIADEMKTQVFARYLDQAKGSGLGMSIVHALVIDRYKGKISLRNRCSDDYTQGTTVEIWLRKTDN